MKKKSSIYFLLMFVFLVLVFLYQYYTPQKFVWKPTFSKYDKQPFGSYVFDDVLSTSIPGYTVVNKTFYQLYMDNWYEVTIDEPEPEVEYQLEDESEVEEFEETIDLADESALDNYENDASEHIEPIPEADRRAILITEESLTFTNVDVNNLIKLLKQGNKVMLCLNDYPQELCDSLHFRTVSGSNYYSFWNLERYAKEGHKRDFIYLQKDSLLSPEKAYAVYPHLHPVFFEEGKPYNEWERIENEEKHKQLNCDSSKVLVRNGDGKPLAIKLYIGAGELFLVATPLLFTNYGILDGSNASYVFQLLSYMNDFPLMRIEAYGVNNQASSSPLRYVLSQPPLQWALYVTLITIILFMIFTAKRKQRIIPIVKEPANETLRFTQLIGNLYFQKKDYKDILRKKYLYFGTHVRKNYGIDLLTSESDEEQCKRLAEKIGQDSAIVWPQFRELKYLLSDHAIVDEAAMMKYVNLMNEWKRLLS